MTQFSALALTVAAVFSPIAWGASDFMQLYQEAVQRDASFLAAKSAQIAGQEAVPQARAGLLPSLGLSGASTYNHTDTQYHYPSFFPNGTNNYRSDGYTLTLTQPIFRGQNYAQYAQAQATVKQVDAQYLIAQQDLILRLAHAYFDVLLAQYNVTLAGTQKDSIAEQLAQAKRNFEVGTATITDTHDAQARYDLTAAQEIAAQNDLDIKQTALEQIIGHTPGELVSVKSEVPLLAPQPANIDAWVEKSLAQNPQIQIAQAAFDIAGEELRKQRAGHLPTVDFVATYGDNKQSGTWGYDQKAATAGVQLNVPLYQGGYVSSKVREAVANQEKARQNLDLARRQVSQQARQAYLGVTSGIAQVKALQQAVVSAQSSLDSTKLGLEVGVRTSVDLLNARQQLFSARRDLAQALYAYILSQLRLISAVGTLGDSDVTRVNSWLSLASNKP